MGRILLLCFIHGFKGTDNTFKNFPDDLKEVIKRTLPDDRVESVVYPQYETKGELAASTEAFLGWLKERVMDLRKAHLDVSWPPHDREVGVILVAHSMGGFIASDTLFRILDDRRTHQDTAQEAPSSPFPPIQGILCFDTPFNGLARPMFVYGAFSNYQKVSNVFNVMTALTATAPASLSRLTARRAAASAASKATSRKAARTAAVGGSAAWKTWQLVAVRTGTVGAIAAGGALAYMHRKEIMDGVRGLRQSLTKESVAQGYQNSVDALGQGLAYVNRGAVGQSFAWLSEHFTFVGALVKQAQLERRLDHLAALKGVGIRDVYASLGENGVWSGGYFVPERTFCAVPGKDQPASTLFQRLVIEDAADEIVAHVSLFNPEQNKGYEKMTSDAANWIVERFHDDTEIYDDPKFSEPLPEEKVESGVLVAAEKAANPGEVLGEAGKGDETGLYEVAGDEVGDLQADSELPDESPIDIAAAASLTPLPDDADEPGADGVQEQQAKAGAADEDNPKQAYMRHLFTIAQQTGTNLKSYVPSKLPAVNQFAMPKVSMPAVTMPSMPTIPSVSLPGMGLFSKKSSSASEKEPTEPARPDEGVSAESGDATRDTNLEAVEEAGDKPQARRE